MTREERENAIDIIQSILDKYEEDECLAAEITIGDEDIEALKIAIKALEQEPVLDKIRAEIENEVKFWSEPSKYNIEVVVNSRKAKAQSYKHCLEIIDKYKEESEETDI